MLRFWLSLNVLHTFLRKLDANIIYLNDHSASLYLNGLSSVGPDYKSLIDMLRGQVQEFGTEKVFVLAISAGGFVGLRAAMDLEAESFAGMSIRSTLARTGDEPFTPFAKDLVERCKDPSMFVDLADLLPASEYPRSIQLYCGEHNAKDRFQAERLTHIPRVEIVSVPGYRLHNPISGLIARGQFEGMLRKFVGTAAPEAAGAVSQGHSQ
jgi:pimeloyl-ACP methyl ester carboxylesterase